MREKARSFLRTILLLINFGIIFLYLLVCLVPFINTGKFWFIAYPGLALPLIFFALFCFIILWALLKSKWFWLSLIVMLLGTQQILAAFSFHLPQKFSMVKQPRTLRVFHWNVEGWDSYYEGKEARLRSDYFKMLQLLKAQNADILCFEEYADTKKISDSNSTVSSIQRLGYPYFAFAPTDADSKYYPKGVIIFSKYPIVDSLIISYGKHTNAEHLVYADIKCDGKIFRIFTTHLQSVRFDHAQYESLSRLKHAKDPGFHDSKTLISKLKKGYQYRYSQAKIVREQIEKSPYSVILTGEFNDVPNSNTYFTISNNMQDVFLKKGSFIGRTFRFISPTLRIDYILADKSFKVNQMSTIHVSYSDHYPVEADLQY